MIRALGTVLVPALLVAACGDGGRGAVGAPPLSYNGSMPFPAVVGDTIVLTPAVSGRVNRYTVSPALPAGLSLDERSGVIYGTPTQPGPWSTHMVSASGAGVRLSFPLVVSVTVPPSGLSYPSPLTATVGVPLVPLAPAMTGWAEHYSVAPTLPPGVELDSANGVLSGTPTKIAGLAPYIITASSLAGDTRFVLLLAVAAAPAQAGGKPPCRNLPP